MIDLGFVDAEDFLRALEIRNVSRSGAELTFSCPSGNHAHGDSRPSARMNVRTTAFVCHGCGWRGNAIHFLVGHRGITESEALRVLEERYGGPESAPIDGLAREVERILNGPQIDQIQDRTPPDESWIESFRVDWHQGIVGADPCVRYMVDERGFDPDVLDHWQVGYDSISRRVTIPVRDVEGRLVGFKGRAISPDQNPKYLIIGNTERRVPRYNFSTYAKSEHVFGLDRIAARAADRFSMIVVEGELNVISLAQKGCWSGVGVAGSEFSEAQAALITRYAHQAVVYFDGDRAGRDGSARVVEALDPYLPVRVVVDPPGDAAEVSAEAIAEMIATAIPALQVAIGRSIM